MRRVNRELLRKLIRLPRSEWADLLGAQAALFRAQLLVWTRPRGRLLVPSDGSSAAGTGCSDVAPAARRLALAVGRAAEPGLFRPSCLVRALALHRMLQSHGFPGASVRVGARRENGRFLAHAWVDYRGTTLADQEWYVKKFDELARMGVSQAS